MAEYPNGLKAVNYLLPSDKDKVKRAMCNNLFVLEDGQMAGTLGSVSVEEIVIPELPQSVMESLHSLSVKIGSLAQEDFVVPELYWPSVHLLARRGKLLRPTLVFLSAYSIGERPSDYIELALSAELLHVSSLIHDDIIDGDATRNDIETVHMKYGTGAAILAGDSLISKSIMLASNYGKDVISAIASSAMEMCAGEILDSKYQKAGIVPSIDDYIRLAELKSASLISASCSSAAIYAKSRSTEALGRFGKYLGLAFQIRDDIIDFIGGEGNGYRPNIVKAIVTSEGLGSNEALLKAAILNNTYVDRAREELQEFKCSNLIDYSHFVKVKLKR